MSPRPDVSGERRPQIIDAAIRVFSRNGYRKTTMPQIAREARLSVGGVYWYFKNKEEIIGAILTQLFQTDMQAMEILLNTDLPAGQRIRQFSDEYVEAYAHYAWLNKVGIEFYSDASHDEAVRHSIQKYLTQYRQALAALIAQGIQRGEFKPVDANDAANVVLGLDEGLSLLAVADPQGVDWSRSFRIGIELLLTGIER
ncbi:MAG: TetR/AcrR family transcriptional regulator [Chloroflexota bacterium]